MGENKAANKNHENIGAKGGDAGSGDDTGDGKKRSNFFVDFMAGGISATIAKTATAPIERVKLIMQTQDSHPDIKSGKVKRYNGILECFKRVYHEQGLKAFWRGNLTNITRYFPTQAFNFAFKDSIKSAFPKYDSDKHFFKFLMTNVASGGLAGAGSLCIVYPLDYARTRLAADVGSSGKRSFNGLRDCLVKTARGPSGFMGLYNGFGISVVGIIPYRGVYFGLYDSLVKLNPYQKRRDFIGFATKFLIAQATSVTAGFVTAPIDTVRRRLQMQSEKPKSEWHYSGAVDCFRKIAKEEGTKGLFKGAGANILRTIGGALILVFYDEVKAMLGFESESTGSE
jgi:solute carrier family 25 (adenine nucleotide translocator) protein 4/5/6/31